MTFAAAVVFLCFLQPRKSFLHDDMLKNAPKFNKKGSSNFTAPSLASDWSEFRRCATKRGFPETARCIFFECS